MSGKKIWPEKNKLTVSGNLSIFVTGSVKTGLIVHDKKFNFLAQMQDTSVHYQVPLPK